MKTFMMTICLLLVAIASAQYRSTTPKYFAPVAGGGGVNINDPNINRNNPHMNNPMNNPNVNINDPNFAQPANGMGQFSSYNKNGGASSYFANNGASMPPNIAAGGLSNSAENVADTQGLGASINDVDGSDAADGSFLNLDNDSDSEASMKQGVNATALGVVLTIIIVLGIFGVVAIILIRQRRRQQLNRLE
ncbi:uncharacterized protein [Antedon mediterranea]|uniref:uncharacterized protein n=1 Tax=Antedon mediterranea TaxID=105859 RepID=UPI003AF73DB0